MRKFISILLLLTILTPIVGYSKARNKKKRKSSLRTDMTFDSSNIHGRYNLNDEALAAVENEKLLSNLLGLRTHFKDRIKENTKKTGEEI